MNEEMICPECGSHDVRYYDGCLGYEAMVCQKCGKHITGGPE